MYQNASYPSTKMKKWREGCRSILSGKFALQTPPPSGRPPLTWSPHISKHGCANAFKNNFTNTYITTVIISTEPRRHRQVCSRSTNTHSGVMSVGTAVINVGQRRSSKAYCLSGFSAVRRPALLPHNMYATQSRNNSKPAETVWE